MSFLEMLDVVNEGLIARGQEPIAFDSDCREGICGTCSLVINGIPHGGHNGTTTCQLHMRHFKDGETITIEPWRARAFPDRQGPRRGPQRVRPHHPGRRLRLGEHRRRARRQRAARAEGNRRPGDGRRRVHRLRRVRGRLQERLRHALRRRQGFPPQSSCRRARPRRTAGSEHGARRWTQEGFGNCTVTGSCEAVCPKEISLDFIAKMNRDYAVAVVKGELKANNGGGVG